ncbi:hypothetical protein A9Q74_06305 [Colwellia sp. 39_35_sub15_T18]|nr:hypothetical protein A9Q74_06305 [Colwellia sp. 39_35_sub15_T18]
MTTNKKDIPANSAVAKSASVEQVLNKHDKSAVEAAKTNTKNDGSHIAKQRQKLIDNANAAKETK